MPGPLVSIGKVDQVGGTTAFVKATLARPNGLLLATASSHLHIRTMEP
jgi:hypothetical protein